LCVSIENVMGIMHFGFILPTSEPHPCAGLAQLAEESGWDGVFIPDCIAIETPTIPPLPAYDPWVTLAAMAVATRRVRLGTMLTALPRRRPWKLAREVMTLDHLSHGRAILAAGIGAAQDDAGCWTRAWPSSTAYGAASRSPSTAGTITSTP